MLSLMHAGGITIAKCFSLWSKCLLILNPKGLFFICHNVASLYQITNYQVHVTEIINMKLTHFVNPQGLTFMCHNIVNYDFSDK